MYDFKTTEKEIMEFWEKEKIYQKSKDKNKNQKPFYFCDGPPYATGTIHPGTAWNKSIKDTVCRYMRMRGFNVRAQAGFDTHGLPIEVKVEQEMKIKNKNEIEQKIGIEKFIQKCKEFASKYIQIMGGQFKSVGVWMDFDKPYITFEDSYIESSWKTLKLAHEQGLMHEGVYVLPYCYRCETTIANYELEYAEETDPSVYAKFKVADKDNEYLMIWTTTPWTLVANMAVMVNPKIVYVKAQVGNEIYLIAKDRLTYLMDKIGESATILEEIDGKKLDGIKYLHPFQDKISKECERKVVLSDEYVNVEDGTGLVHCAPGHGPEDFIIGKRYGVEAFSPVDAQGNYTKEAGVFAGKNVRATNQEIIQLLKDTGVLVYEERIRHRYPHCWRCKTQLIYLTTKQWFITISKMKDKMLFQISKTNWTPDFAKERFKEFVNNAPDWCISRQRYWGIPLPIWKCKDCSKIKVISSRKEISKVEELHRPYIDKVELVCECKGKMHRIPDVLDVWFDSGNAVWASMTEEEKAIFGERADLILEGQDQIRGWFYSLLGSGLVRYDACPYKNILMHGFFVDEKGEKMSKSVGNFVPLEDILAKHGADSFRLWSLSNTIWDELKFNWEELRQANADLNIMLNLVTFLERFYPAKKISSEKLNFESEDLWLLSKTNNVIKDYIEAFSKYEINKAVNLVRTFVIEDLSRSYMKLAKDRIGKDENKEAALYVIYYAMLRSVSLLAPITPFISEHLYQKFFKKFEETDSVALLNIVDPDSAKIDDSVEKQMGVVKEIIAVCLNLRQEVKIKVRWPIRNLYIQTKSHEVKESIDALNLSLKRVVNVKNVVVSETAPTVECASFELPNAKIYLEKTLDEELYSEGIVNEVKRRIQMQRKTENLVENDKIEVSLSGDKEILAIVEKAKDKISREVNAHEIKFAEPLKSEEYEIDGRVLKLGIKKVNS
ncbi:MAG: isoleucine--tRNA ligase [Candidatus Micrarchaeota archaeon]